MLSKHAKRGWGSFMAFLQALKTTERGDTFLRRVYHLHPHPFKLRQRNLIFWQAGYFLKKKKKNTKQKNMNVKEEKEPPPARWLCLLSLSRQRGSINPHINHHCLFHNPFMLYVTWTATSQQASVFRFWSRGNSGASNSENQVLV